MNATIRLGLTSVLLMLAGGLTAYAPAAFAQTSLIRNVGIPGRCLAVRDLDNYVRNVSCNASDSKQIWTQVPVASGVFLIRNAATGRCVASAVYGGGLQARACDSTLGTHRWRRSGTSGAAFFQSVASSKYLYALATGSVTTSSQPVGQSTWAY
jgi:hypothetical protein